MKLPKRKFIAIMFIMNILFIDRNFSSYLTALAKELAKDLLNAVAFITNKNEKKIENFDKIIYHVDRLISESCHPYAICLEDAVIHGEFAANAALELKNKGLEPDIIIGDSTGASMFIKDVFLKVPYLCYFETFNNAINKELNEIQKIILKSKNANLLIDLCSCDAGITSTIEQKNQFPKEFHDKIKVLSNDIKKDLDYISSLVRQKESS